MKIDLSKLGITPGPWAAEKDDYFEDGRFQILKPTGKNVVCNFFTLNTGESTEYNAKLIATAPKMLKNEISSAIDAKEAIRELEKETPDINLIYQLLMSIEARSVDGAKKATDLPWPEVKIRLGV